MPASGQEIASARLAEKGERILADHAAIHDPDAVRFAETSLNVADDPLDGLQILGVAGPGAMGQGKAFATEDQGEHDLLAIAAMIAGIAALSEFVFLGQAFEVGAGQVVQQQVVVELKERAEPLLQVVFDLLLGLKESVQGVIEPILRDDSVGYTEQIVEGGRRIPMFSQGELAARLTEAVDDFDGHDVGGADRLGPGVNAGR